MSKRIIFGNNSVYVIGEKIDPSVVFNCGQCFRFNPTPDGWLGIAHGKMIHIISEHDTFMLKNVSKEEYEAEWKYYFDLDLTYPEIVNGWNDEILKTCCDNTPGMRLLNQEPFETLISFIISANNNIGRIRGTIEKICKMYGEPFTYKYETYYKFPTPEALAAASVDHLNFCGCGYRSPYIIETAKAVAESDILERIAEMDFDEAKKTLCTLKGVGPKVADCVLLFAFNRKEAFPKDVWIRRVLNDVYGLDLKNDKDMDAFAHERFGKYAGIAQQYLFHYMRKHYNEYTGEL